MNSSLLDLVENVAKQVSANKVSAGNGQAFLKRIIHGPALALVVKLTPNPLDDLALEFFKSVIPKE